MSDGFVDAGNKHRFEYDPCYLTATFWSQNKPEGATSALAQFLNGLPTGHTEVQQMVDRAAAAGRI